MIYRLMEDVSPYYLFTSTPYFKPANNALSDSYMRRENLALWKKQTGTSIKDKELERYVYGYSAAELTKHKAGCTKALGADAYDFLLTAKQCEEARAEIYDPWYYPCKNDPLVETLQKVAEKGMAEKSDRYFGRYVLQTLRALTTLRQSSVAVNFWEKSKTKMENDIIGSMAERQAARAYLQNGDTLTACRIYARMGDVVSLCSCGMNKNQIWEEVLRYNPNSPFFVDAMQMILTHVDNNHMQRDDDYDIRDCGFDYDVELVTGALRIAKKAVADSRVKDKAMWYYSAAALLDAMDKPAEALTYVTKGTSHCRPGSFMESSMRVLRIYLEARTCKYTPAYAERLATDMKWLFGKGKKHITPSLKENLKVKTITEKYGDEVYTYTSHVTFPNKLYWSDAINRILADVLAARLFEENKMVDAMLLANVGEFWLIKNATGKAHSPNDEGQISLTDHTNVMTAIADGCSIEEVVAMYRRLTHPANAMDRLVAANGLVSSDYWTDYIGTRCIAEHRYLDAVKWLSHSSDSYQRSSSTYKWYNRDPFCVKLLEPVAKRHTIKRKPDYKLTFAKRMADLHTQMKLGKTVDQRAEAMVLYGVGLRNQSDWCWALSRFGDSWGYHEEMVDEEHSQELIDNGLAMMNDKNLKARYLHAFARNKEVMDLCPGTKVAEQLRAHCDTWKNYKRKR